MPTPVVKTCADDDSASPKAITANNRQLRNIPLLFIISITYNWFALLYVLIEIHLIQTHLQQREVLTTVFVMMVLIL